MSLDLPSVAGESTLRPDNLAFSSPTLATLTRPNTAGIVPPLGVGESSQRDDLPLPTWQTRLTVRLSEYWPPVRASASVSVTHLFFPSDGRRGLAVACGPHPPAEHHWTVSAILKPFPPAWRGLPVRCPKSYNLPSDAARAPPVTGFSSHLLVGETIRLAA